MGLLLLLCEFLLLLHCFALLLLLLLPGLTATWGSRGSNAAPRPPLLSLTAGIETFNHIRCA